MHIAIMMDNERLAHEHGMLKRLCVGLIDQGVQLTRIVPDRMSEHVRASERSLALAHRLEVPMSVLPWMRSARTQHLANALDRNPPDVLYVLGREMWPIAMSLAEALDRPVALDVWSASLVQEAPRRRAAQCIGGYIVPTAPLAEMLRQRVDGELVSLVPRGVAVRTDVQPVFHDPQGILSAAVIGSGRDLAAYRTMLAALARVARTLPQLQVVLELRGRYEHDIWRELRRLDLRSCVSVIEDASMHRSLITRCDALIVPEAFGEVDSLLLECMAVGMAIVARHDPCLDMLENGHSAFVLESQEIDDWAKALKQCFGDPAASRSMGRQARDVAIRRYRSSDQVHRLLETLERITSGETFPFPKAEAEHTA